MRGLREKKRKWDLKREDKRGTEMAEGASKDNNILKGRRKLRMRISEICKGACGIDRLTEIQRNINRSRAKKARAEWGEEKNR